MKRFVRELFIGAMKSNDSLKGHSFPLILIITVFPLVPETFRRSRAYFSTVKWQSFFHDFLMCIFCSPIRNCSVDHYKYFDATLLFFMEKCLSSKLMFYDSIRCMLELLTRTKKLMYDAQSLGGHQSRDMLVTKNAK